MLLLFIYVTSYQFERFDPLQFVANSTVNLAKNRTNLLCWETTTAEFLLWWHKGHLKWFQNSRTVSHAISVLITCHVYNIVELYWCTETIVIAVSVVAGIIVIIVGVVVGVVIVARMLIRWDVTCEPRLSYLVWPHRRAYRSEGPIV